MILANTYHLWVRPGHRLLGRLGGLHGFMGWDGPILTDSGGYQVFSLRELRRVGEEGVKFRSPHDGEWRHLTPEKAVQIQESMGVDVAMALDECIPWPAQREAVQRSTARTTRWLGRCIGARLKPRSTALFGIVQGGMYVDLRTAHAQEISELGLDGYAIGGLSVGEPRDDMLAMVDACDRVLPRNRPRYLMGVGYPLDIVEAAVRGVDMFDCVLPTRSGRFGQAFTSEGRRTIKHARYREDDESLDPLCSCYTCRSFSRAYLRHLFMAKELLAPRLLSLHNVSFYQALMARIQEAIQEGPAALERLRSQARVWSRPVPA